MEKQIHEYTVYMHESPSGKVYIGITSNNPEYRWNKGRGYRNCKVFYNAIIKYGWENIKHRILFTHLTKEEAESREKELIAYFHSNEREHGYNLMSGGSVNGHHSIETRQRMKESHTGSKNWAYGRKHTPEECERIGKNRVYTRGPNHPSARPILQLTKDGELVKRWGSISEASLFYCRTSIKDVLKGKYKTHRGYVWKYESEDKNAKRRKNHNA